MKIKLTKQQSIIITITTLLLIIGLCFIFKITSKPTKQPSITNYQSPNPTKTFDYDDSQTYEQNLERWKNQCDFKPGVYKAEEIRKKLGRSDRKVYCLDSGDIEVFNSKYPIVRKTICAYNAPNYQLDYKYSTDFPRGIWYFTRNKEVHCAPGFYMDDPDICHIETDLENVENYHHIKFNTYVDITPPPKI